MEGRASPKEGRETASSQKARDRKGAPSNISRFYIILSRTTLPIQLDAKAAAS
jgi:hypothetical protein